MSLNYDYLIRLKVALETDQPLPFDVSEWLLDGANMYEEKKGSVSLCQCLGLSGRGIRSIEYLFKINKRDKWLRTAWSKVSTENINDWPRAKRLSDTIKRFQSSTWPRIKNMDEPPERLNDIQRSLFYASKSGLDLPVSPRRLLDIATK